MYQFHYGYVRRKYDTNLLFTDADGLFSLWNCEENRKTKGVNKYVATDIRHKEFVDVLFNEEVVRYIMKRIQSKLHSIGTYEVCKISLSCFDNKR